MPQPMTRRHFFIFSAASAVALSARAQESPEPFVIRRGDRIAQMVIAPFLQAGFQQVDQLDETERGAGGFGSTGA